MNGLWMQLPSMPSKDFWWNCYDGTDLSRVVSLDNQPVIWEGMIVSYTNFIMFTKIVQTNLMCHPTDTHSSENCEHCCFGQFWQKLIKGVSRISQRGNRQTMTRVKKKLGGLRCIFYVNPLRMLREVSALNPTGHNTRTSQHSSIFSTSSPSVATV